MLVLSRHRNESLVFTVPGQPDIVIKVCEIGRNKVRLAIEAPASVLVRRGELVRRGGGELPGAIPGELRETEE